MNRYNRTVWFAVIILIITICARPSYAGNAPSYTPATTPYTGTELWYCDQAATDKSCSVTNIATFAYLHLSGDCTATLGGAITCLKSNGIAFGALASKTQASLTADVSGLLPIANGGTGTASPGIIAGTNITVTGAWPNQTVNGASGGGVTSAAATFTGGLISVAGSPITTSGTFALTVAGTSGGIPYFSSSTGWASSAALTANAIVVGGGAGAAPAPLGSLGTTTTVLHGNVAGAPTFGAVALATDVSGILPLANGGTGQTSAAAAFNALSPMTTIGDTIYGGAAGVGTRLANGTSGQFLGANTGAAPSWQSPPGGTVTSAAETFTGGIISVAGSPITTSGTFALTVAGTSGGIPYFSSATGWASSAVLTANLPVIGGGAGAAPSVGTVTGNTTKFATSTGAVVTNDCAKWDANGNIIDAGAACGGSGGALISGTPAAPNQAQWTDATHVKGVSQGMFNVRTMYGAIPDGSTDNSTTIAAAFTASNGFATNNIPTVYFDCDTGSTTCTYNYGGSGISPLNPTKPTTIMCAPGVTLNYTGTAHAVDLGPTGLTLATYHTSRYTVQGCRFTGGASYTAGIYVNNYIINTAILYNEFWNFGVSYVGGAASTAATITYDRNVWEPLVDGNFWRDSDGVTRNMVDSHLAINGHFMFSHNANECATSGGVACSISTYGYGVWMFSGWIVNSEIQFHYPDIRLGSCGGGGACGGGEGKWVINNGLEGNPSGPTPQITYGDPGTVGATIPGVVIRNNNIFSTAASGVPNIGPETASSSNFDISGATIENNQFTSAPTGGAPYVKTGPGVNVYVANNFGVGVPLSQASSPPIIDAGFATQKARFGLRSYQNGSPTMANAVAVFDSNGVDLQQGNYHNLASPRICSDGTGSGTAQVCNTAPASDVSGANITLVAGDEIIYKTTTANTGDLTILVDSGSAVHVRKFGGMCVLAADDVLPNVYYPLTYDGTYLEISAPNLKPCGYTVAALPATAALGAVIGNHAYVTDAAVCTFQGALTGGGSTYCPVSYSGAAWLGGG